VRRPGRRQVGRVGGGPAAPGQAAQVGGAPVDPRRLSRNAHLDCKPVLAPADQLAHNVPSSFLSVPGSVNANDFSAQLCSLLASGAEGVHERGHIVPVITQLHAATGHDAHRPDPAKQVGVDMVKDIHVCPRAGHVKVQQARKALQGNFINAQWSRNPIHVRHAEGVQPGQPPCRARARVWRPRQQTNPTMVKMEQLQLLQGIWQALGHSHT
jgi:hypothetical protein